MAIERTRDSGASWTAIAAPAVATQNANGQFDCLNGPGCVEQLRFGSTQVGYAYRPSLFHTLDGGRSWQPESSPVPTLMLEYAGQSAFRIAGYDKTYDCFGGCHLQRASGTGATWRETGIVISMAGASIVPEGSQRIYVFGLANSAGGAQIKKAGIYYSRDAGASWHSRTDPCPGNSYTVGAATAPTYHLVILCRTDATQSLTLIRSDDGGLSFHQAEATPVEYGLTAGSATAVSGLAYGPGGTTVQTTLDGGVHWRATLTCPVGTDPTLQTWALGYQDARTAHIICPESTVWRSKDGGASWVGTRFGRG